MEYEEGIYPSGMRVNGLYADYATIAMENYFYANEKLGILKSYDYQCAERIEALIQIERHVMINVVFAAMCIESFFNDYAAACLGDKEFYDSFDMLSPEGKFKLICSFILKHKIDKSKSYYCRLKELVRARKDLIHNKSKKYTLPDDYVYTGKACEALEKAEFNETYLRQWIQDENKENEKSVGLARNALLTLKEIAELFDSIDPSAVAMARIFGPNYFDGKHIRSHPIDKVLREFRIGMD